MANQNGNKDTDKANSYSKDNNCTAMVPISKINHTAAKKKVISLFNIKGGKKKYDEYLLFFKIPDCYKSSLSKHKKSETNNFTGLIFDNVSYERLFFRQPDSNILRFLCLYARCIPKMGDKVRVKNVKDNIVEALTKWTKLIPDRILKAAIKGNIRSDDSPGTSHSSSERPVLENLPILSFTRSGSCNAIWFKCRGRSKESATRYNYFVVPEGSTEWHSTSTLGTPRDSVYQSTSETPFPSLKPGVNVAVPKNNFKLKPPSPEKSIFKKNRQKSVLKKQSVPSLQESILRNCLTRSKESLRESLLKKQLSEKLRNNIVDLTVSSTSQRTREIYWKHTLENSQQKTKNIRRALEVNTSFPVQVSTGSFDRTRFIVPGNMETTKEISTTSDQNTLTETTPQKSSSDLPTESFDRTRTIVPGDMETTAKISTTCNQNSLIESTLQKFSSNLPIESIELTVFVVPGDNKTTEAISTTSYKILTKTNPHKSFPDLPTESLDRIVPIAPGNKETTEEISTTSYQRTTTKTTPQKSSSDLPTESFDRSLSIVPGNMETTEEISTTFDQNTHTETTPQKSSSDLPVEPFDLTLFLVPGVMDTIKKISASSNQNTLKKITPQKSSSDLPTESFDRIYSITPGVMEPTEEISTTFDQNTLTETTPQKSSSDLPTESFDRICSIVSGDMEITEEISTTFDQNIITETTSQKSSSDLPTESLDRICSIVSGDMEITEEISSTFDQNIITETTSPKSSSDLLTVANQFEKPATLGKPAFHLEQLEEEYTGLLDQKFGEKSEEQIVGPVIIENNSQEASKIPQAIQNDDNVTSEFDREENSSTVSLAEENTNRTVIDEEADVRAMELLLEMAITCSPKKYVYTPRDLEEFVLKIPSKLPAEIFETPEELAQNIEVVIAKEMRQEADVISFLTNGAAKDAEATEELEAVLSEHES